MSLVIEDGSGKSDANSYLSVADCDTYIENHGGSSAWLGVKAESKLSLPVNPTDADTFTIGDKVYTMEAVLTNVDGNIQIGSDAAETLQNILDAINLTGTAGTQYAAAMTEHPSVEAINLSGLLLFLIAKEYGASGNLIDTSDTFSSSDNGFSGTVMAGGADASLSEWGREECLRLATQYIDEVYANEWVGERTNEDQALAWPRSEVYDYDGYLLDEDTVPQKIKDATAEMAKRAITDDIYPDLTNDGVIESTSVSVGPISKSTSYMGGKSQFKRYSIVDKLLVNLVQGSGKVYRA